MGRETETKECGTVKVRVQQHEALEALRLSTQIAKLAKSAFEDVKELDTDEDAARVFLGVAAALSELNEGDFKSLLSNIFKYTTLSYHSEHAKRFVDHPADEVSLNEAFSGTLNHLIEAIAFALKVNFAKSFGAGMRNLAGLVPEGETATKESE